VSYPNSQKFGISLMLLILCGTLNQIKLARVFYKVKIVIASFTVIDDKSKG
jgi:hypothetical protein